jgi:hypothetical protein
MGGPIREVPLRLKRRILLVHASGPAFVMLLLWTFYLADALFQVDLMAILKHREQEPGNATTLFVFAVIATVVAIPIAWLQIRKAMSLAQNGVEVIGRVTKMGRFSLSGFVKTVCEYSYEGVDFTHAWSHARFAEPLSVDDLVALIVDPTNPKRCMLKDEVCLTNDRSQDG